MFQIKDVKTYFRYLNKQALIFIVVSLLLFNAVYSFIYQDQLDHLKTDTLRQQEQQVEIMEQVISGEFEAIYNDLKVIQRADEFTKYIEDKNENTRLELGHMLMRIATSRDGFTQLRFLNLDGKEEVRVNKKGDNIELVPEEGLQNKFNRYYFQDALKLSDGEMYISEFDLNVENGVVVKPYEPTIRYAIPIFQDQTLEGVFILNYDGTRFISNLQGYDSFKRSGIETGILDHVYYWKISNTSTSDLDLASPLQSYSQLIDSQNAALAEVIDNESGTVEFQNYMYHYETIEFKSDLPMKFRSEKSRWKVMSKFDMTGLVRHKNSVILDYPLLRYVYLFIVAVLALVLYGFIRAKEDKDLMLRASTYISSHTHDGIVIADKHMNVLFCNKVFEGIVGWKLDEMYGMEARPFFVSDLTKDKTGVYKEWEGNIWLRVRTGVLVSKRLLIRTVEKEKGRSAYYIGIYSTPKMSKQNKPVNEITEGLTHYINDYNLVSKLGEIDDFLRKERNALIMAVRIHEFSKVMHQLPEYGENYLIGQITSEFKSFINQKSIILAPLNELLVVIISGKHDLEKIEEVWRKLDLAISNVNYTRLTDFRLDYSCGVSLYPEKGTSGFEVVNQALVALDANVKVLKVPFLMYDTDISEMVHKDLAIQAEVDNALNLEEIYPVYQIQNDSKTNAVVGVEVLARWKNAKFGAVSPEKFIPMMEADKSIKRLGIYMLKRVLADISSYHFKLSKDFRISLNLSSEEFMDKRIVSEILYLISQSPLEFTNFCIEITESAILKNVRSANQMISYLNEHGVIVAIDDFGTGFSSLSYLKQLKVDKIKIDRMFIMDYPFSDDGSILKGIVEIARSVDIPIIVEGVETTEQLKFIRSLNCWSYQGYLGSKPLVVDELKKLLDDRLKESIS